MQIIVELNVAKEIIWGLPGSKAVLTASSPKAQIDLSKLNDAQKRALAQAISVGKLISSVQPHEVFSPHPVQQTASTAPVARPAQLSVAELKEQEAKKMAQFATDLLAKGVAEIRKQIMVVNDLRQLKVLLLEEQKGKNRATLVKILVDQIEQFKKKVAASLNTSGPELQLHDPARMQIRGQTVDYDVVESEQQNITVKVTG